MGKEIINTAKLDPLLHLAEAMFEDHPGQSIENEEARGAQQMVRATHTLPTEGSDDEALSWIEWGPVDEDDPLFREGRLPEGYTRRATGHSMWTDILDPNGQKVASVGYKAAFYDRWAMIRPFTQDDRDREAAWLAEHPEEA